MNYKILGKYIKDLEFSIPNPKTFFLLSKSISNYKINLDIKSEQIKPNILEVLTTLSLIPIKGEMEKYFIFRIAISSSRSVCYGNGSSR